MSDTNKHIKCKCGCWMTFGFEQYQWKLVRLGLYPLKCLKCGDLSPPHTPKPDFNAYAKDQSALQSHRQTLAKDQTMPAPVSSYSRVVSRLRSYLLAR